MNPVFWRNKKVFLTGHTGFKGSWLSLWLQSLGAQVTGYALPPPTNLSLFEVARVADGMVSVFDDIRNYDSLYLAMKNAQPDFVIHMAAQPLVRYSYENPVQTYSTNVMGTVHLLEAVRRVESVKSVVNVTTDKCYENKEWEWGYREVDRLGGYDCYSNSKACSELVTGAYRASFFGSSHVSIATARAGNVIGGGDWAQDRLIPDILNFFNSEKLLQIRNPRAIRPWQFVLEPLRGYLTLAENLYSAQGVDYAGAWNFGPLDADAQPVEWIVNELAKNWPNARWEIDKASHPHEANYLKLDISKAYAKLGWAPKVRLNKAIDFIIEWSNAYDQGDDMRSFSLQQLSEYENLLKS